MKMVRCAAMTAAVAGFLGLSALPASAVTGTCSVGNLTYSLSEVAANNGSNVFCSTGNPDYSGSTPTETFFGMDYVLSFKSDEAKGDGEITFTDPISNGEAAPATWAISDPTGIASQVVIVLKQSNSFAAFLLSSTSGNWSITQNGRVKNEYSHVDIWYKAGETTVIPLPASGLLLLAGLAGLGYFGAPRPRLA